MRPFSFGRPPGSCYCMLVLESISVISDCPFGDQGLTAKCCRTWGCNPSVRRYTQFWFSWCPGTLESLSVCSGAKRSQTGRSMLIEHVCECTYKHTGGDTNARMNARWWGIHACLAWCWGGCTGWMYVYSVSLFIDTNDERWSWYSSIYSILSWQTWSQSIRIVITLPNLALENWWLEVEMSGFRPIFRGE